VHDQWEDECAFRSCGISSSFISTSTLRSCHEVEAFKEVRFNDKRNDYEVQVNWRDLDDIETSWEPVENVMEDVPVVFGKYLKNSKSIPLVKKMMKAQGWN
jgi:hypothetical protein